MTTTIRVKSSWGAALGHDEVNLLLRHADDLADFIKDEVPLTIPASEALMATSLDAVFTYWPALIEALDWSNTKDRRDALRLAADVVCENASSTDQSNLLVMSKPKGTPASVRNALTQANLTLMAAGLLSPRGFELRRDLKGVTEANKAIASKADKLLAYVTKAAGMISGAKLKPKGDPVFYDVHLDGADKIAFAEVVASDDAATTKTTTEDHTTKGTKTMTTAVSNAEVAKAIANDTFNKIDPVVATLVDGSLKQLGLPGVKEIGAALSELTAKVTSASAAGAGLTIKMGDGMKFTAPAGGVIPNGKAEAKRASVVFGLSGSAAKPFDFDVPVYEWDGPHPHVPAIDPDYQFQPEQLLGVLVALITNQRAWLYGDTGCGKTTVVEQVAARLNYPVIRVNFDSEITRMDLIGAKDIVVSGGHPVTTFTEGVLPMAMQMPCIFLADELDFIRADVAYVFQRALEGNGLTLPEDAGRMVHPHAGFRIIATGNTQGNGDESGKYQGAKPQSAAFLDRFTMWLSCDYMKESQIKELLAKKYPTMGADAVKTLAGYAREHWAAFKGGQVLTALSPRGLLACAMTYTVYSSTLDPKKAMAQAMQNTFLDRASKEDAQTIKGLISRVIS